MPNEYLMLGDGSISSGNSFLADLPERNSSKSNSLREPGMSPIDPSSGNYQTFNKGGENYLLAPTGAIYTSSGDPYAIAYNSGKTYLYEPNSWGTYEGRSWGILDESMMSPQEHVGASDTPKLGSYDMYSLEQTPQLGSYDMYSLEHTTSPGGSKIPPTPATTRPSAGVPPSLGDQASINTPAAGVNYDGPTANLNNMSIKGTFTSTLGKSSYLTQDNQLVNAETGQVYGRMLDNGVLVDMSDNRLGYVNLVTGEYVIETNGTRGTFELGGSINDVEIPMDPLGDASNRPEMQKYYAMLDRLSSPEYLAEVAEPFLQNAYNRIGQSNARSSSFADQLIADSFNRAYLQTVPEIIGGQAAVPGMLAAMAPHVTDSYKTALEYINQF